MDDLRATPIEKGGAGPGEGSRPPLARSPRLEDPAAAPGSRPSWRRGSVLAVAFAGLLLRLALALAAPRWGFVGDHVANLMWGMAAADHGITNVYRIANGDLPSVTARWWAMTAGGSRAKSLPSRSASPTTLRSRSPSTTPKRGCCARSRPARSSTRRRRGC